MKLVLRVADSSFAVHFSYPPRDVYVSAWGYALYRSATKPTDYDRTGAIEDVGLKNWGGAFWSQRN